MISGSQAMAPIKHSLKPQAAFCGACTSIIYRDGRLVLVVLDPVKAYKDIERVPSPSFIGTARERRSTSICLATGDRGFFLSPSLTNTGQGKLG